MINEDAIHARETLGIQAVDAAPSTLNGSVNATLAPF